MGDVAVSPPRPAEEAESGSTTAAPHGRMAYNPALDGIRGLAVAAVLLFHGGFSWARGGYLGVSTFFTLSGFLITSLLIGERARTGRVDLPRFWTRRLRRLFPASALTLVAVSLSALLVDAQWERNLRGDALASLLQVANWRMLFDERSYAELFSSPSPLVHFWSLAIEEQFYWLFPLVTAGLLAVAKGSLRVYAAALGGLVALSGAATLLLGPDEGDTVYYATYTRMGEILLGSLLAVAVTLGVTRSTRAQRAGAALGVVGLAAFGWAVVRVAQTDPVLDRGGLLIFALVSAALVLSATVPGPVRRLLAVEPLRLLGVVSYGVYLFHWPLFVILDQDRTGLDDAALMAVRTAATLVVATASYLVVERPVRRGWRPRWAPMPALALGSAVLVAGVAVAVPRLSDPPADPFAQLASPTDGPDPASVPAEARIGYGLGDSSMFMTGWGLSVWGAETGRMEIPKLAGGLGCSIGRGGERRSRGKVGASPAQCDGWAEAIRRDVPAMRERYGRADFALVQTGQWDVADRLLPGDDEWRSPGDPVYDEYLRAEFLEATDLLVEQGLTVVWLTSPHLDVGRNDNPPPAEPFPESDPDRVDRMNEIIRSVARDREGAVVVDLYDHLESLPEGEDERLRPDGVHFSNDTATEVARGWLAEEVLAAIEREPVTPDGEPAAPSRTP